MKKLEQLAGQVHERQCWSCLGKGYLDARVWKRYEHMRTCGNCNGQGFIRTPNDQQTKGTK